MNTAAEAAETKIRELESRMIQMQTALIIAKMETAEEFTDWGIVGNLSEAVKQMEQAAAWLAPLTH